MKDMQRVEFHCHTHYSKDSLAKPEALLAACRKKNIDRLVITDHNTIAGALYAQQLDPERVIVGEEIMTQAGELLAFFINEEVPAGLPPLEAAARLKTQGAFISVSHPFDHHRQGHWQEPQLLEILPFLDAIEVFNARCLNPAHNDQAAAFALKHSLPGTVGSDAHAVFEAGRSTLVLPAFQDATGLRQSILQAQANCKLSSPLVHFTSRLAVWYKQVGKFIE